MHEPRKSALLIRRPCWARRGRDTAGACPGDSPFWRPRWESLCGVHSKRPLHASPAGSGSMLRDCPVESTTLNGSRATIRTGVTLRPWHVGDTFLAHLHSPKFCLFFCQVLWGDVRRLRLLPACSFIRAKHGRDVGLSFFCPDKRLALTRFDSFALSFVHVQFGFR